MNEIMTMVFFFVEMLVPTTQIFPPLASVDHQPQNVPEIIDRMSTNQSQNCVLRELVFHLLHHDKSNYKEGDPHLVLTLDKSLFSNLGFLLLLQASSLCLSLSLGRPSALVSAYLLHFYALLQIGTSSTPHPAGKVKRAR